MQWWLYGLCGIWLCCICTTEAHSQEGADVDREIIPLTPKKYGSGTFAMNYRELSPFSAVTVACTGAKVFIQQGVEQSVKIETDDNFVEEVLTRVFNGVLTIQMNVPNYRINRLNITITTPVITAITTDGADLIFTTPLYADSLSCTVLNAHKVVFNGGTVKRISVSMNGSAGFFDASSLKAENAVVSVLGNATECLFYVTNELTINDLAIASSLRYKGSPTIRQTNLGVASSIEPIK